MAMEHIQFGGRRMAGFGVGGLLFPDHSVDEALALIKLYDARMQQLADSFKEFGPKWMGTDPATFSKFVADYVLLQARYGAAKIVANSAMLKLDPDTAYNAISKAMRQNYPPDGAELTNGDWADLFARITSAQQAAGEPLLVDRPPTDLANVQSNDFMMKVYKATAPLDVIAQLTGEEKQKLDGIKYVTDTAKWFQEHRTGIAIGAAVAATVVVGGVLYAVVRR
jgi:hypothetical protein